MCLCIYVDHKPTYIPIYLSIGVYIYIRNTCICSIYVSIHL